MSFNLPDLLVLAAAGTYFLGYLIINQVYLRLFVLFGTFCYIGYYATVEGGPLWIAVWTSVALAASNVFGLTLLLRSRSRAVIPAEFASVYDEHEDFQSIPPGEFRTLVKSARKTTYDEETVITTERVENEKLYYVLDGSLTAEKLGQRFALPPGLFVGEVAYLLKQPASATVTLKAGTTVLEWDSAELRSKADRNPQLKLALRAVISRDLARKVSYAIAPDILR